jgi:EcsC protein family
LKSIVKGAGELTWDVETRLAGWGGRLRTSAWRNQNPPICLETTTLILKKLRNRPIAGQWVSVPVQNGPRRALSYFQCRQHLETLIGVGPFLVRTIERWRQTAPMTEEDLKALRAAAATLEHPGLAARLGNIAGKPIELVGRALPEAASEAVAAATTKALHAALAVALRTMEKEPKAASRLLHKALAAASGAVGGGFGLAALPVELPISTIIMLRSIGDIARSEGEGRQPRAPGLKKRAQSACDDLIDKGAIITGE